MRSRNNSFRSRFTDNLIGQRVPTFVAKLAKINNINLINGYLENRGTFINQPLSTTFSLVYQQKLLENERQSDYMDPSNTWCRRRHYCRSYFDNRQKKQRRRP